MAVKYIYAMLAGASLNWAMVPPHIHQDELGFGLALTFVLFTFVGSEK
jgi:hypothetical protein